MSRRRRTLLLALGVPLLLVLVWLASVVGPMVRDDLMLDRAVRAVALDWRDFGEDAARARLQHELDAQGIGLYVGDDDCSLVTEGEQRVVRCAWRSAIRVPGTGWSLPLEFASSAVVDASGSLH